MGAPSDDVLDATRAVAAKVAGRSAEIEQGRRLPLDIVAAMVDAGLFRLCVPEVLGGREVDPLTLVQAIEEMAAVDAAAGWCLMIGATTGTLGALLAEPFASEIYADPGVVTGGVVAPRGRATPVDGGHRVTGQWPFASGCQHCQWLVGGCILDDRSGTPALHVLAFPAADVEILDTWVVSGLAGTGSNDIRVHDAFVPEGRAAPLPGASLRGGALYAFPLFGLLALGVCAVALGIARAAVDELTALAGGKTPTLSRRTLAERPVVQVDVARAVAALGGARAYLVDVTGAAWDLARDRGEISVEHRAQLRLAACHATTTAAAVVDTMYGAGGGSSIYATSPLQRHFRDVHAVTQHAIVGSSAVELAGRVLLGVPGDTSQL